MEHDPNNPFDPSALRLSQEFGATIGVKKHLMRVPVRKPHPQEYVRVRSEEEYRLDTAVLDLKEDREVYIVDPKLHAELSSEIVPVRLYTTINRQGILTLWNCRLPGADGKTNPWHESAIQAAELAMKRWVRVTSDMSLGAYQPFVAEAELPDPDWPDLTLAELLEIAFRNAYIDNPDHAALQRLRGQI